MPFSPVKPNVETLPTDHLSNCPVCHGDWETGGASWLCRCQKCKFLSSSLDVAINESNIHEEGIDEDVRFSGLKALREQNYERIIAFLSTQGLGNGKSVLDVGCAYGWFLDVAKKKGFETYGVEPDRSVIRESMRDSHKIYEGFFPDVLSPDSQFDVISFHDVFEHLPDVRSALEACHAHLNEDGLLVINLPNKDGFFYRVSKLLYRFGMKKPFERMWQKDFPSPHLSYFSPDLLQKLVEQLGFSEIGRDRLETLSTRGLWERVSYDQTLHPIFAGLVYIGVLGLVPVLRFLPPDITVQYFRKS